MYTTILFDWEGVITPIPERGTKYNSFSLIEAELKRQGASQQQASEAIGAAVFPYMRGKCTDEQFWQTIQQVSGVKLPEDFGEELWKGWMGQFALPEMLELIQKVRDAGFRTAIFSNILPPGEQNIRKHGSYKYFDIEILSCNVGYAKPEQEIYTLALERLNEKPENCLFVDDKQKNLDVAKEKGIGTILATSPQQIITDVQKVLQI